MPIELDRESATPLHEQIYQKLRAQILAGEIGPDKKLPESEEAMMERLGLARGTISRAMKRLQGEGLVVWTKGLGLFTAKREVIERIRKAERKR